MIIIKSAYKLIHNFILKIFNILVPEDIKIDKILKINSDDLYSLLPKSKVSIKDIFVLFDYQNNTIKILIKSIKYRNNLKVKKLISRYLYDEIVSICSDQSLFSGNIPILLPMPMSKKEKKERGFNQCEEVVKELEKLGNKNFEVRYDVLFKTKETLRQTKLSKTKRIKNVVNSMRVFDNSKIKDRTIIVFDDVFTTLSTYNEARRVLLKGGSKKVMGLFIAH
jgi:competence protein ComFC